MGFPPNPGSDFPDTLMQLRFRVVGPGWTASHCIGFGAAEPLENADAATVAARFQEWYQFRPPLLTSPNAYLPTSLSDGLIFLAWLVGRSRVPFLAARVQYDVALSRGASDIAGEGSAVMVRWFTRARGRSRLGHILLGPVSQQYLDPHRAGYVRRDLCEALEGSWGSLAGNAPTWLPESKRLRLVVVHKQPAFPLNEWDGWAHEVYDAQCPVQPMRALSRRVGPPGFEEPVHA